MNCGSLFSAGGGANRYCSACKGSSREKRAVVEARKSAPCADCGRCWPAYCMQFDHMPGCVKLDTVSRLMSGAAPLCVMLAEIAKCEVVCMNCHAIRTRSRGLFVASSVPVAGPSEWVGKRTRSKGVVGWAEAQVEPLLAISGRHWPAPSLPEPVPVVPVRRRVPVELVYVSLEERRGEARPRLPASSIRRFWLSGSRNVPSDPKWHTFVAHIGRSRATRARDSTGKALLKTRNA